MFQWKVVLSSFWTQEQTSRGRNSSPTSLMGNCRMRVRLTGMCLIWLNAWKNRKCCRKTVWFFAIQMDVQVRPLLFEMELSQHGSDCFFTLFLDSPAQHRCGTAFHCLSLLSSKTGVTISRRITAPGHGKSQLVFVAAVNFVLVPSLSHIQLCFIIWFQVLWMPSIVWQKQNWLLQLRDGC